MMTWSSLSHVLYAEQGQIKQINYPWSNFYDFFPIYYSCKHPGHISSGLL